MSLTCFYGYRRSAPVHCMTSVRRSTLTIQNFILTSYSPSSRWRKWRWKSPIRIRVHAFLPASRLFFYYCWKGFWHHDRSRLSPTDGFHSYISISQQLFSCECCTLQRLKVISTKNLTVLKYWFIANGALNKFSKSTGEAGVTLVFSEQYFRYILAPLTRIVPRI